MEEHEFKTVEAIKEEIKDEELKKLLTKIYLESVNTVEYLAVERISESIEKHFNSTRGE